MEKRSGRDRRRASEPVAIDKRGGVERRKFGGRPDVELEVRLPATLEQRLQRYCLVSRESVNATVIEALELFLAEKGMRRGRYESASEARRARR